MNHTFGYILCCQSPALFLLAIALVIFFFVRRGRARIRAVLSLLVAIVCIALGVVLYYQGMLREYFAVRNFWHIRIPGWVGLILVAVLLVYLLINALLRASARRSAEKARRQEMEKARADAYEAGRTEAMSSLVSATAEGMQSTPAAPADAPESPDSSAAPDASAVSETAAVPAGDTPAAADAALAQEQQSIP